MVPMLMLNMDFFNQNVQLHIIHLLEASSDTIYDGLDKHCNLGEGIYKLIASHIYLV